MPKIIIDGKEYDFADGTPLIEACEQAGMEVPRFCYHERLSIAGNCRMCLVEVVGGRRSRRRRAPCRSTTSARPRTPSRRGDHQIADGQGPREGVMEFLLINHPLDCPICDQGGECDLQDQAMGYGIDTSAIREQARGRRQGHRSAGQDDDDALHPLHPLRPLHDRSRRHGGDGRDRPWRRHGDHHLSEKALTSEMQGNVIDLCPVGALTSRPLRSSRGRGN